MMPRKEKNQKKTKRKRRTNNEWGWKKRNMEEKNGSDMTEIGSVIYFAGGGAKNRYKLRIVLTKYTIKNIK